MIHRSSSAPERTPRHGARVVTGTLVAAATLLAGGFALPSTAIAADGAENAPSVAGHAYNNLPTNNPDVTVTQIDNSALPSYLRNPIGQNEGTSTPDDLSQNYYSADASTLAYDGKLFVFTGHDEAAPTYGSFNMKDWGVYVTDQDGLAQGTWTHYKTIAKADLFDWSTGDGAYAGQVVADDGGTADDTSDDWFYYYVPVKDRASQDAGLDPFAIGVAKSKSPLGPWEDAIGAPLLTTSQTQIETIDPAFFVDDDGTGYLHFGTFGTQLAIKMQKDAATGRTSYTKVEQNADGTPALHTMKDAETGWNGPKGFFEAAWVFKKGDTYYNVYDGGKPGSGAATCVESNYQACIQYSTSSSPLGPWTYQGVIVPSGSATTMHPSIQKFGDKWYVTYHTGDKAGGTDFRRAVSIDEVNWTADGKMTATAHPTKAEKAAPSTNVAPYATVNATFTEVPSWRGSVNDGRVLEAAVVPPNHWDNYREVGQPQSGDSLIYQWDGQVRVNSAKVWFDVDSNALRAPASWRLQYLAEDGTWKDVSNPSGYGTSTGKANPNEVTFDAVTTTALKLDMTAQPMGAGYASVAVAEWEVGSAAGEGTAVVASEGVTTATGTAPALPATVNVKYGDGDGAQTIQAPVIWRPIAADSYAQTGTFKAYGVVSGVLGGKNPDAQPGVPDNTFVATVTVKDGYVVPADTAAPTVTVALGANASSNGWLSNAPVATVQASDAASDGAVSAAPVAKIEVSTNQGKNWTTVAANTNAAVYSLAKAAGDVEVWARATDAAGNVSDIAKVTGKVDAAAPTVTATVDKSKRTVTLAADDGAGSGVASIEYRLGNDGEWTAYADGQAIAAPSASRATVFYRATDKAGNVSTAASVDIPSDTSVPLTGYIEQDAIATDVDNKASSWTKGIAAVNDGRIIPDITVDNADIWGTWPATGELKIDYEWDREVTLDSSRVQFTSDGGGLGIPTSWKLQYWDASAADGKGGFVDIPDATYTVTANSPSAGWATGDAKGWSDATWTTPVKTTKLRMIITSGTASPAIAEWQAHAIAGETPEPPAPVDKSALEAALNAAPKAEDAAKYTDASWAEYAPALEQAQKVLADDAATEADVADAAAALPEAAKKLVLLATEDDRKALGEQLNAAATVDRTLWTAESLGVLDQAVERANALAGDAQASQADVQAAAAAIDNAIKALVPVEQPGPGPEPDQVDKTALAGLVNKAQALKAAGLGDYTEASAKALTDALTIGEQVLADKDASKTAVEKAAKALDAAIKGLAKKGPGAPSDNKGETGKPGETLSNTGAAVAGIALAAVVLAVAGAGVTIAMRKRRV